MDMDKVIKGLETCIPMKYETNEEKECRHEQCPYGRENYKPMNGCFWDLMSDALALLKEQEARILQWDEIKDYPVVYGEFKGVSDIYPLIITLDNFGRCLSWNPGINVSSEYLLLVSDEEDRKNTRCWNKMPTDEQRQSVKWE